ncbi:MAG: hypothetical protein Q7U07_08965 [Gammaproteobacteria bacterium]|nr:hypothetical protein [Gammaproteobacteria bacterium]
MRNGFLHGCLVVFGVFVVSGQAGAETPVAETADTLLVRAAAYYSDGNTAQAEALYREALGTTEYHAEAYGRLVQIALSQQDAAALKRLFGAHRAFAFEAPQQFRPRIQQYEMLRLRNIYNEALQAALSHQWTQAEGHFSRLLGDELYHRQATGWLFRLAMQQKNFERAKFIAGLAQDYADNPAATPELLAACVLQRTDQRAPALAQIKKVLTQRGAYRGTEDARVDAQRAVYLAMIRLHEENDQCYLNAWKTAAEARPYFPALPDAVLQYLAR